MRRLMALGPRRAATCPPRLPRRCLTCSTRSRLSLLLFASSFGKEDERRSRWARRLARQHHPPPSSTQASSPLLSRCLVCVCVCRRDHTMHLRCVVTRGSAAAEGGEGQVTEKTKLADPAYDAGTGTRTHVHVCVNSDRPKATTEDKTKEGHPRPSVWRPCNTSMETVRRVCVCTAPRDVFNRENKGKRGGTRQRLHRE